MERISEGKSLYPILMCQPKKERKCEMRSQKNQSKLLDQSSTHEPNM